MHVLLAASATTLLATGTATAAKPPNPCLDPEQRELLLCPDLTMKKPFGLELDLFAVKGRTVLRAGNSIDSVGDGPATLHGIRNARYFMRGRQWIYRRAGGKLGINTGARLFFKAIPDQPHYWKFHDAARFELWRIDGDAERTRLVRTGPKVSYCLRDLDRSRPGLARSPKRRVYPACNTKLSTQRVTIGTSVGWSDVYPPGYHEQWIDVTGLRGCFHFVHIADPLNGIYEYDERNNSAYVTVRLPFSPGPQLCPGLKNPPRTQAPASPRRRAPEPSPPSYGGY